MRLVVILALLASISFCDTDYITCSTGTRDYDNETLFEAAQGNLSGRGYVISNGCSETLNTSQITISGQTNASATDRLVFKSQTPLGRIINFTSLYGFETLTDYTIIQGLKITLNGGRLCAYTTRTGVLVDGCLCDNKITNGNTYGFGQEGTGSYTLTVRNTVIITSVVSNNAYPAVYATNSGSKVELQNCTINWKVGFVAQSTGTTLIATNTAIKGNTICLSSTNSPTYTLSKVYTSDATGTNTNITDGQFNFDTDGYSLLPGSVLINAGNDIAGFTNSINGVTRPSGYWDVGAYELSSGNPSTGTRCGILYRMGLAPRSR